MNCSTHSNRPAVYECDNCGKPICKACYDDFDLPDERVHLCSDCYTEYYRSELAEVIALKGMVKREFIFIIIGMVLGLILGIYFAVQIFALEDMVALGVILIVYLPFIGGSLMTIIKRIRNQYLENRDTSGDSTSMGFNFAIIFLTALINILIAPITTIVRLIQRIGDMRQLNRIEQSGYNLINAVEQYIANSLKPSTVEQSAEGGSADVEISLDAILASGSGSEAALCDNGEILRTIRTR